MIKHIALHEILHLFGYIHIPLDDSGVMYPTQEDESLELSPIYRLQLPMRAYGVKFGFMMSFGSAIFFYGGLFAITLVPFMIGMGLLVITGINKLFSKARKIPNFLSGIYSIFVFILISYYNTSIESILLQFMLIFVLCGFYYPYAYLYYEMIKGSKKKKKEK